MIPMSHSLERARYMPETARKQEVSGIIPANPLVSKFVEAVSAWRNPWIFADGLEQVAEAEAAAREGLAMMVVPNHLSNWDHAALEQAYQRYGFGRLRGKHVYPLGISLQKNRAAQIVNHMVPTIPVWPSRFPTTSSEEERRKREMNLKGTRAIVNSLNEGRTIVIYPEASRGTKPEIEPLDENIHGYFRRPNMVILPVSLTGTEIVLPKGKWWPTPYPVTVTFGKPIYTDERLERYAGLSRDEIGKRILDDVMTEVARNLPECYRGIYADRVRALELEGEVDTN